jgi:hypothetical protein
MRVSTLLAAALVSLCACRSKGPQPVKPPEHAVIVHFKYGLRDLSALRDVENKVEQAVRAAQVGEYDGDEIAVDLSDGSLYMYGPNGDGLFAAVRPVLESASFMRGAVVTVRYGPPGSRQDTTTLGTAR